MERCAASDESIFFSGVKKLVLQAPSWQDRLQAAAAAKAKRAEWNPFWVVEGQEEGEHQHAMMGRYELMEGKVVNGRGVWKRKEGKEGQKDNMI